MQLTLRTANVVALQKQDGERFVFLYDDTVESCTELQLLLSRYAADTELSMTWGDAGLLWKKAKELKQRSWWREFMAKRFQRGPR